MSGNTIAHRPVTFATPAYRLVLGVTLVLLALLLAAAPLRWASAGLAAIALGILILIRPAVGLAAVALAIPFGNFVQLPGLGVNGVDVLVALTITGWLARGIADRRLVFHRPPLTWSLLIFVWCAALSLTQATSWRDGLPEWFKWAEFAALYLVATQVLDQTQRDLDTRRPVCRRGCAGRLGDLPVHQPGGTGSLHHSGTLHACLRHFRPAEPLCGIPGLSLPRGCQPDAERCSPAGAGGGSRSTWRWPPPAVR